MKLPAAIGSLTLLTTLNLSQCRGIVRLPAEVGCLTSLTSLLCPDCSELVELPVQARRRHAALRTPSAPKLRCCHRPH